MKTAVLPVGPRPMIDKQNRVKLLKVREKANPMLCWQWQAHTTALLGPLRCKGGKLEMRHALRDTPRIQAQPSCRTLSPVICKETSKQGWFFRGSVTSTERTAEFQCIAAPCTCHKSGCHGRSMTSAPPVPQTSNMKLHILSRAVAVESFPHQQRHLRMQPANLTPSPANALLPMLN